MLLTPIIAHGNVWVIIVPYLVAEVLAWLSAFTSLIVGVTRHRNPRRVRTGVSAGLIAIGLSVLCSLFHIGSDSLRNLWFYVAATPSFVGAIGATMCLLHLRAHKNA